MAAQTQSARFARHGLYRILLLLVLCASLPLSPQRIVAASPATFAPTLDSQAAATQDERVTPQRLIIEAIGVDTTIEAVGKGTDGQVGVPQEKENVAWYSLGVAPGEQGNAVIAGHLDDKVGPAIFWRLRELEPGDTIIVIDSEGVERTFVVTEVASYRWDEAPLARIFGFDLERDLNLITCAGQFSRRDANYSRRLVVYTRLVP